MDFKAFSFEMKNLIKKYLAMEEIEASDYTWLATYIWNPMLNYELCERENALITRLRISNGEMCYRYPIGPGKLEAVEELIAGQVPFAFIGATGKYKSELEENFPGKFVFAHMSDFDDYVYNTSDLINLSGKKYHSKKNHLNAFRKNYSYKYEKMTPENAKKVIPAFTEWSQQRRREEKDVYLECEQDACLRILENFVDFEVQGGVLYADGQIAAFTISEQQNTTTAHIAIEKANPDIIGAFNAINQMHLENQWAHLPYVNREDDFGIEGIRRAKESYRPAAKIAKYKAEFLPK